MEQTPSRTLKALFEDEEREHGADSSSSTGDDEPSSREYSRLTFLVGASVTESLGNLAVSSRILPPGKSYIATATRYGPLTAVAAVQDSLFLADRNGQGRDDEFHLQETKASLQDLNLCLHPGLKHQRATLAENEEGLLIVTRLLRKELRDCEERNSQGGSQEGEKEDRPRVMIFFPNEKEAKAALEPLRDALWGDHRLCVLLPQTGVNPLTMLNQFRKNETTVMLATPNSVRGLDVPGLTHVYSLYLPRNDPREYVHLAGRVGRVGQAPPSQHGGNVISILRQNETLQMNELAQQLDFEFTDIDTVSLRSPTFVIRQERQQQQDTDEEEGDDDDVVDLVVDSQGDVESMRRYLEDSMTLLKWAEDATSDKDDDDVPDYDGLGSLQ